MNLFHKYYQDGSIKGMEDLKRAFRALAKKIHPDIVGSEVANERFAKLRSDFVEYSRYIGGKPEPAVSRDVVYTRKDVIELLMDLDATGFLLTKSRAKYSKPYIDRLDLFNEMIHSYGIPNVTDIKKIESEIVALKNLDGNRFAIARLLIESVLSYHYEPRSFVRASVDKLYREYAVTGAPGKDEKKELDHFIAWLVEDMDKGSIYPR